MNRCTHIWTLDNIRVLFIHRFVNVRCPLASTKSLAPRVCTHFTGESNRPSTSGDISVPSQTRVLLVDEDPVADASQISMPGGLTPGSSTSCLPTMGTKVSTSFDEVTVHLVHSGLQTIPQRPKVSCEKQVARW